MSEGGTDPPASERSPSLTDTVVNTAQTGTVIAPAIRGGRIGRFVVLDTLGVGAMGVVLAAYDEDLDRKVAIKLLRPEAAQSSGSHGIERLLREARAMAKISHPNVLVIHEVGTVDDQVFLAMELVAGGTLSAWCKARSRSWREIVATFVKAARGLDAAHRAGLVHRDFKPANVLLTSDGDVRVADFGIVGIHGRADPGTPGTLESSDSLELTLTRTGALLGTPMYMAPEQHAGVVVGPAADQFALCVSLWDALYGVRPFAGTTYAELADNVRCGNVLEPPPGNDVPAWLRDVVRRGLQVRPEDRWPSVAALIEALEHDPVVVRRQRAIRIGLALTVLAFGGLALFALLTRETTVRDTRCERMDQKLAGVWDPPRAAKMRAALVGTKRPYAANTAERVVARLDDYAREWVGARIEACEKTHLRGEQSEALLDLRMTCLDARLDDVRALVDVLAKEPSVTALDLALVATAKLPPLEGCADTKALQEAMPPPADPAQRAKAEAVDKKLREVQALAMTGHYREAFAAVQPAAREAVELGFSPLIDRALSLRGMMEHLTGDFAAARASYEQALLAAGDAHDNLGAAKIWIQLIAVIGSGLSRPDEALVLVPGAEAAVRNAGGAPKAKAALVAALAGSVGSALHAKGKDEDARAQLERARAVLEKDAPDNPLLAATLGDLAVILSSQGKFDEARRSLERSLALREKLFGPDHPEVATALASLGDVLAEVGARDQAREHLERSLAMREKMLGPDDPAVASSLDSLGDLLAMDPETRDEARRHFERALAIKEKTLGPNHPNVANTLNRLGSLMTDQGKYDEAKKLLERALALREKVLGPDHARVAPTLLLLGKLLRARGKPADALPYLTRCTSIYEKSKGANHYYVTLPLMEIAEVQLDLRHFDDARAMVERVVARREAEQERGGNDLVEELGEAHFALARALTSTKGDKNRALELAKRARNEAVRAGVSAKSLLDKIDTWLAAHDRL